MSIWHVPDTTVLDTVDLVRTRVLDARGVPAAQHDEFFNPTYAGSIGNPFDLADMQVAVERILAAVDRKERILVWGDYDADGVSATALLVEALSSIGAQVAPYLPHRSEEGYGLHRPSLERIHDTFDLLITVDCGGSNTDEIAWLHDTGRNVIVVDHHELPAALPPATAILHPRHPNGSYSATHLSGAGVAWKLAQALLRVKEAPADDEKWLLDLAVLGTLADSMPLLGENRAIVHFGLQVLARTRRPGLVALREHARLASHAPTAEDVIFRLVPPLNAAGRMDHPQAALDVLTARTAAQGQRAAAKLMQLNQQRRQLTQKIMKEAERAYDPTLPLVFAYNANWSAGIVGIVAGRLAEQFQRPAVVIGGAQQAAVGSARTFGGIDVYAALRQAADHTAKLGGHKQAAGFSLEPNNITPFREALIRALSTSEKPSEVESTVTADGVIDEQLLTWDLQKLVETFEPFGEANQEPAFVVQRLAAAGLRSVGKSKQHLKTRLVGQAVEIDAIGFDITQPDIKDGDSVDVVGAIQLNRFNGNTGLQLRLLDIAPAGSATINT